MLIDSFCRLDRKGRLGVPAQDYKNGAGSISISPRPQSRRAKVLTRSCSYFNETGAGLCLCRFTCNTL